MSRPCLPVLLSVFVLACLSGCVTRRDQVAVVRGAKFCQAEGSGLGQAVAAELVQVAVNLGAVGLDAAGNVVPGAVDPAAVTLDAAAAAENARGLAAEREARSWLAGLAAGALDYAKTAWPPLGVAVGALGGLWALWRRLQGAQTAIGAAVTITQRVKEALADGKLTLGDFKAFFARAGEPGPDYVAGAAELKQVYDRVKAEWTADGTPIRSAPDGNPGAN